MPYDKIFSPLSFNNLTIKNRILRSNLAGRFDNYDGTGAQARINWEVKFARSGVGAIVSSFVPVHPRGRILPNYATIVSDDRIPFWRALGKAVHEHDCKYILQLSHGGRQRDIPTIDYPPPSLSSTAKRDPLHGFECEAMTLAQIKETVRGVCGGGEARPRGGAGRRRTARRQRLPDHAVSELRDQRPDGRVRRRAGEPRAIRPGDRPGNPRSCRSRLSPADEDQRDGIQRRAPSRGETGQYRRGLDPGLPVAERGRRRRHRRVVGRLLSAPEESGRRPADRRAAKGLRQPDIQRRAGAAQLHSVHRQAHRRHVQAAMGRRRAVRRTGSRG